MFLLERKDIVEQHLEYEHIGRFGNIEVSDEAVSLSLGEDLLEGKDFVGQERLDVRLICGHIDFLVF